MLILDVNQASSEKICLVFIFHIGDEILPRHFSGLD